MLFANEKLFEQEIETQAFQWEEWNRVTRMRLESYFRVAFVFTLAWGLQSVVVMVCMNDKFKGLAHGFLTTTVTVEFVNLFFTYRML